MSIADVFEDMTTREAARIVVDEKLEVDIDHLADCIKQVSRRRSGRLVSSTRKRGVRETVETKAIETTIRNAAQEAVDSAVELSSPEREEPSSSILHRLGIT